MTGPNDTRSSTRLSRSAKELNRPGMSGDSDRWEGWSHARRYAQAVPA